MHSSLSSPLLTHWIILRFSCRLVCCNHKTSSYDTSFMCNFRICHFKTAATQQWRLDLLIYVHRRPPASNVCILLRLSASAAFQYVLHSLATCCAVGVLTKNNNNKNGSCSGCIFWGWSMPSSHETCDWLWAAMWLIEPHSPGSYKKHYSLLLVWNA